MLSAQLLPALCYFIYVTLYPPASASIPSIELPIDIRTALQANAAALAPTITISWNMDRSSTLPPRDYAKAAHIPRNDAVSILNEQQRVKITWQADDHYRQAFDVIPKKPKAAGPPRFHLIYTYDGQTLFIHTANPDEPRSIERTTAEDYGPEKDTDRPIEIPYFDAIALPLPVRYIDLKKRNPPTSLILDELASDSRLIAIDPADHDLVRLRVTSNDPPEQRFYLDPKLHYALRRSETLDDHGHLASTTDCTDFQQVPHRDLWLPHTCAISEYADASKNPIITSTYHVTDVSVDLIPPSDFLLNDSTPGTWFFDHYGKNQQIHILQKDGTLRLRHRRIPPTEPGPQALP
jgi:hypothetical protein